MWCNKIKYLSEFGLEQNCLFLLPLFVLQQFVFNNINISFTELFTAIRCETCRVSLPCFDITKRES